MVRRLKQTSGNIQRKIYRIGCALGENVVFDVQYLFLQVLVKKHCLDLLFITCDDILKKKDAHVQVKHIFFFSEIKYGPLPSLPTLIRQCPSKKTQIVPKKQPKRGKEKERKRKKPQLSTGIRRCWWFYVNCTSSAD